MSFEPMLLKVSMIFIVTTIVSLSVLTFHNFVVSLNRNSIPNPEANIRHTSPLLSLLAFFNSLLFTVPILFIFLTTNKDNLPAYFIYMLMLYFFISLAIALFVTNAPESLTGLKEDKSGHFIKTIFGWPLYVFSNMTNLFKYGKTKPLFQVNV